MDGFILLNEANMRDSRKMCLFFQPDNDVAH